jgi:hypothetical protein
MIENKLSSQQRHFFFFFFCSRINHKKNVVIKYRLKSIIQRNRSYLNNKNKILKQYRYDFRIENQLKIDFSMYKKRFFLFVYNQILKIVKKKQTHTVFLFVVIRKLTPTNSCQYSNRFNTTLNNKQRVKDSELQKLFCTN